MRLLVAYASKSGYTKGIAEFIGERLNQRGIDADVFDVEDVKDPSQYDAFAIGSALYMFHWMKEAKQFVMRNKHLLATRPVWLFSSGPIGTSKTDTKGRNVLEVSGPKEIDELREATRPRDHKIFFGGLDGSKLTGTTGFMYRMVTRSKSARDAMPEGDFRDWKEIEAWANSIADAVTSSKS